MAGRAHKVITSTRDEQGMTAAEVSEFITEAEGMLEPHETLRNMYMHAEVDARDGQITRVWMT
jgi:hypothetical protein